MLAGTAGRLRVGVISTRLVMVSVMVEVCRNKVIEISQTNINTHLDDAVEDVCGAVSSLEEDGDVPGDTGGDQGLVAGGDEEGGGEGLGLAHHSPHSPVLDPWEEGAEPVLTDRSQAQPGLQSLADQRERTGLLGLLAGLHLLAKFLHKLFEEIILGPQLITVAVTGRHPARAQSATAGSLERFPEALRPKSCSV